MSKLIVLFIIDLNVTTAKGARSKAERLFDSSPPVSEAEEVKPVKKSTKPLPIIAPKATSSNAKLFHPSSSPVPLAALPPKPSKLEKKVQEDKPKPPKEMPIILSDHEDSEPPHNPKTIIKPKPASRVGKGKGKAKAVENIDEEEVKVKPTRKRKGKEVLDEEEGEDDYVVKKPAKKAAPKKKPAAKKKRKVIEDDEDEDGPEKDEEVVPKIRKGKLMSIPVE